MTDQKKDEGKEESGPRDLFEALKSRQRAHPDESDSALAYRLKMIESSQHHHLRKKGTRAPQPTLAEKLQAGYKAPTYEETNPAPAETPTEAQYRAKLISRSTEHFLKK